MTDFGTLTALHSVTYHWTPHGFSLQGWDVIGWGRLEHFNWSTASIRPLLLRIQATLRVCVPFPHSAEHLAHTHKVKLQMDDACAVCLCVCVHGNYLTPGSGKPLQAVVTGAWVTQGHFWGAFLFAAVQREISHMIYQTYCHPGSIALTTLCRALRNITHMYTRFLPMSLFGKIHWLT